MPDAHFLETYPLYRKFDCTIAPQLNYVDKPQVNMDCETCGDRRTFAMVNEYFDGKEYTNSPSAGESVAAKYGCMSCRKFFRWFYLIFNDDLTAVRKIGQFPAWSIKPNADVSNMLGAYKNYLVKGLICESQSYGIGAFAYYRRIVEEVIDGLLNDIEGLISEADREVYAAALSDVKQTRVAAEKIDLVKDLLPSILRPDGMNPLALLHGILSEGLHSQTDEECLELAVEIREILTFLASQVAAASESSRNFSDRMRSLLDKRSKS
ncbi:MAG: hypothetical protein ACSHW2_04165 [Parasphingopyxis sp.]